MMVAGFMPANLLRDIFKHQLKIRERPLRHGGAPSNGMADLKEELSILTGRKPDSIEKVVQRIVNEEESRSTFWKTGKVNFNIVDEFLTALDLTYLWHADEGLAEIYES